MTMEQGPRQGGVAAVLQVIAVLSVFGAFFGGAVANLSLGAEIMFVAATLVGAALLWAVGVVVQELRNIEFNTRRADPIEDEVAAAEPVVDLRGALDDAQAMGRYGITRDGKSFVFGEYRYDRLSDAIAYAQKQAAT